MRDLKIGRAAVGAIAFGLVHIPVSLHTATADHGIDFDWLDKRSMDPVGYKRIN